MNILKIWRNRLEIGFVKSQGRLTVPVKLRKKYGIKLGTRVNISQGEDGIKIITITPQLIDKNRGFLKGKSSLLKVLQEEKKKEREL